MRILSVDDDIRNLYLIESIFGNKENVVVSTRNGAEAIDTLEKESFDLIISDILMPEVDGWQLCYEVKTSDKWKNIPFVFYTATYTGKKDEEFSMSLGASRFIIKPAEPGIFLNIINSIIEESKCSTFDIPKLKIEDELRFLKAHNDRLVNKLNQKVIQLQNLNENLQNTINEKNREISDRKQMEKALRESEEIFKFFMEHSPIYIFFKDENIRTIRLSKNYESMLGKPMVELLGKNMEDLFPSELSKSMVADDMRILKEGKEITVDEELNGRIYTTIKFPIHIDGKPRFLAGYTIDVTERRLAEEALRNSEELFRNVFQYHAAVKIIIDPSTGNIIDANDAAVNYYGWSHEQITRMNIQDINTLSPEEVKADMEKVRTRKRVHFEFRHRRADGSIRDVEIYSSNIKVQGKDFLHSIIFDITERKVIENALMENERKYRELFERMSSGVAVYESVNNGEDFLIKDFNSAAENIERLNRKEVIGKPVTEAFPGIKDFGLLDILRKVWKTGSPEFFSMGVYKDDRTTESWRENWVYKLPSGEVVAVYNDITERKRAEEELKASEAKLARAQKISRIGNWEWAVKSGKLIWSDEIYGIFGFSRNTDLSFNRIAERIHPDDHRKNMEFVDRLLNSDINNSELEFRIISDEGDIKYIHQYAEVIRDEHGMAHTIIGTMQDISAIKQIEQTLSSAQQIARIGSWEYDADSNRVTWSAQMFRIFDRDPALGTILWKEHRGMIHPDDWDNLNNQMKQVMKSGIPFNAEFRIMLANNEIRWAWSKCEVILDSKGAVRRLYGIIQDITERKITEEALKKSEERLKNAQEMAHLGGWEFDLAENRLTWSDEVFRIFGIQPQQFAASYEAFLEAVHPEDREKVNKAYSDSVKNNKNGYEIEHRIIRKGTGEIRHVYEKCEHIKNRREKIIRSLGMVLDITESKRAEEELKEYRDHLEEQVNSRTIELEKAKEDAISANRAKSIFLSSMSHEIRTPLNAIIGFSQLLLNDEALSVEEKNHIQTIYRSGEHLLELINNILELSRIEAGHISFKKNIFNLRDLFLDIEMMFLEKTGSKKIEFNMLLSPGLPKFISTDEGKLRQILINLLGNAVKFTEKGSITVDVKIERYNNGIISLITEVIDTGPGITESDIGNLFHAFSQTETGKKAGGTGLGLDISMQYAKLLGGNITVRSKTGEGSCFTATINIEEVKEDILEEQSESRKITGIITRGENYRILIADDDDNNRILIKNILNLPGFQIIEAVNGLEAVELFKTWSPHIILMDMRMPVMDGYKAIVSIKEADISNKVKIIAVTASAFEEDREKVMDWGADGYLRKPFKVQALLESIQKQLNIEYIFEEAEKILPVNKTELTSSELTDIPDDIVDKMIKACINLEYDKLQELNTQIGRLLPETGIKLQKLLITYQYDALIRILQERKMIK